MFGGLPPPIIPGVKSPTEKLNKTFFEEPPADDFEPEENIFETPVSRNNTINENQSQKGIAVESNNSAESDASPANGGMSLLLVSLIVFMYVPNSVSFYCSYPIPCPCNTIFI
jgi:hypothetical protein